MHGLLWQRKEPWDLIRAAEPMQMYKGGTASWVSAAVTPGRDIIRIVPF